MAEPHGVVQRNLATGSFGLMLLETLNQTEVKCGNGNVSGIGHGVTESLPVSSGCVDSSILSIFEDNVATGEVQSSLDAEHEATLLSALTDILDSVDDENLSPFDTLPDAAIFRSQRQNIWMESPVSDLQCGPHLPLKPQVFPGLSSHDVEEQQSKVRRRPWRRFRSESDPPPLEPWPSDGDIMESPGPVSLAELVKHMHPYCLRICQGERETQEEDEEDEIVDVVNVGEQRETSLLALFGLQVEDMETDQEVPQTFVEQGPSGVASFHSSDCKNVSRDEKVCQKRPKEETFEMCPSSRIRKRMDVEMKHALESSCRSEILQRSALLKTTNIRKEKKKVRFASVLTSFHEFPPEGEPDSDLSEASGTVHHVREQCSEPSASSSRTEDFSGSTQAIQDNVVLPPEKASSGLSKPKSKALSLQQYRILRQRKKPQLDQKLLDQRTKWPSLPEAPSELPAILCLPRLQAQQVTQKVLNGQLTANTGVTSTVAVLKPQGDIAVKQLPKTNVGLAPSQKCIVAKKLPTQVSDPPNPAMVPLPCLPPFNRERRRVPPSTAALQGNLSQKEAGTDEILQQASHPQSRTTASKSDTCRATRQTSSHALGQPEAEVKVALFCEVKQSKPPPTSCRNAPVETRGLAASTEWKPAVANQTKLPPGPLPKANDSHCSEGTPNNTSVIEKGIEACDLTSLLEQFEETQAVEIHTVQPVYCNGKPDKAPHSSNVPDLGSTAGLTPPATPPHQIWKPRPAEATKPSPVKTIQIIDPRPLPPSKSHSRPTTPAHSPWQSVALPDHDYCITQREPATALHKRGSLSASETHTKSYPLSCHNSWKPVQCQRPLDYRTLSEDGLLSGSIMLSPDSSPCSLENSTTVPFEEAESQRRRLSRYSAPSASSPGRERLRTTHYRKRWQSPDSSSRSSSCSSCSSSSSCSSHSRSCSPPMKRLRSRSRSSSCSSTRSSSCSPPSSPVRHCGVYRYARSRSRSLRQSRSRSRSKSQKADSQQKWENWQKRVDHSRNHERRIYKQKAIEERRVVYIGRVRGTMTHSELRERFSVFGRIEDCTLHFRSYGDNYGFITYYSTDDAFDAIENGGKLRKDDELPFDLCFGGRRQFCKSNYADLDSNRETGLTPIRSKLNSLDFDALLKQAQRGLKR